MSKKTKEGVMDHQDWNTYIVHCKHPVNKTKELGKNTIVTHVNKDKQLEKKIENGELKHKKMDEDLKKDFQKWRQSRKLTQKDVASKLNVNQSIINDFETGKLRHNPKLVSQIKRLIKK